MALTNQTYKGDITFTYEGREYVADVTAKATYYYRPGRKYMANGDPGYPDEESFDIDDIEVHSIRDKETEEVVEETEELSAAIGNALDGADGWEDDEPPEPDYDYYEERAMARWERELDRCGL